MRSNVAIAGAPTALALLPGEDHFATVAKIAQPTLDAIVELRKALNWLDRKRQSAKLFDPADVEDLLSLIPTEDRLRQIKRLFREAEHEPALESWVNLTIGVMLQSIPEAADVPDAYRLGIVDSAFRDPDIWGADPGFSSSVIVRAIRECRRHQGVPSSAGSSSSAASFADGSSCGARTLTSLSRFVMKPRKHRLSLLFPKTTSLIRMIPTTSRLSDRWVNLPDFCITGGFFF